MSNSREQASGEAPAAAFANLNVRPGLADDLLAKLSHLLPRLQHVSIPVRTDVMQNIRGTTLCC